MHAIKEKLNSIDALRCQIEKKREGTDYFLGLLKEIYKDQAKVDKLMKCDSNNKMRALNGLRENLTKEMGTFEEVKLSVHERKKQLEKAILGKARIVCTTLSTSVIDLLDQLPENTFEYLIVDEACQSVELQTLIPLAHDPSRVILVGDQQQLPATVFSENADTTKYSRSLFERFIQNGVNKYMLAIQYRMNPVIRQFPSDHFYEGNLQDADAVLTRAEESYSRSIAQSYGRLTFYDIKYGKESSKETSKCNYDEADYAVKLFSQICE